MARTHLKNAFGLQSANFGYGRLLGTHRTSSTNRSCGGRDARASRKAGAPVCGLATKFARFRLQSHF